MKNSNEIMFFLSPNDLAEVMRDFDNLSLHMYYKAYADCIQELEGVSSLLNEPNLGHLKIGDWNHSTCYLISDSTTKIIVEQIRPRKGNSFFSIEQLNNPDTILFKPSGIFSERILIAGSATTISNTSKSKKIFNDISSSIKNKSIRINPFYVGLDAREKLNLGWRLTTIVSSPREYDLTSD